MQTLKSQFRESAIYWGERGNWLVVAAVTRDSGCLDRANFDVAQSTLRAIPEPADWPHDEAPAAVERASHWACGWIDYLVVHPDSAVHIKAAEDMRSRLEDYPILDEEHFSQTESEEADEVWRNCYRPAERVRYIREHASQFEFRSLADMLACVRGHYFAGYAPELLD